MIEKTVDELVSINKSIDDECIKIFDSNELLDEKIIHYKNCLENLILEYHKICVKLNE